MKKFLAIILSITMLIGLAACNDQKLYTEDEFLQALESEYKDYNAKFVIVESDKTKGNEITYTVALKDNTDQEFEVTNYLRTSGSDIGPLVNSIKSTEIRYYFENPLAYEAYMLKKDGRFNSEYHITPKFGKSKTYDGNYYAEDAEEGDDCIIRIYNRKDEEVYSFKPGSTKEYRGYCWDKLNYNIWIQKQGEGLFCYKMTDEVWELSPNEEKPDHLIYNLNPGTRHTG